MKGMFRPLNLALSLSDKLILDTPVESTHTVESAVWKLEISREKIKSRNLSMHNTHRNSTAR